MLITAHLAIRAWGIFGGWFYTDDFRMLYEARHSGVSFHALVRPYDSQFMPGGRLVAWLVEQSGSLNWTLAATSNLVLQAATSIACFLMLRSLFGQRPGILAPLSLYLFSAVPFPAFMWWAASLNQLPMQLSFFLVVWAWTAYLRRPVLGRAALAWAALALGLVFYVKTLLFTLVLAYLAVAYFARGGPVRRLVHVVRRYWLGLGGVVLGAGAFTLYYVTNVPQLAALPPPATVWGLAGTYLGRSFGVTMLGGPWLWWQHPNPPTSQVDVPALVVAISWAVIALVVLVTALLRRRTLRAWVLVAGYLLCSFAVLVTSRGAIGAYVGLELRYLTDLAAVVSLAVGLAYLPLVGALESSEARTEPVIHLRHAAAAGVVLVLLVCLGGAVSTYGHARIWHTDNPGRAYVANAVSGIRSQGSVVNIADKEAPPDVMIEWSYPHNLLSRLLPLTGAPVRFPRVAEQLNALDQEGRLHPADLAPGAVTATPGPVPNCGWLVRSAGAQIPLERPVPLLGLWMRIGYLSSADGEIVLTLGRQRVRVPVREGLHDVYVRTTAGFDRVGVSGLTGDAALCAARVEVGQLTPGGTR